MNLTRMPMESASISPISLNENDKHKHHEKKPKVEVLDPKKPVL